MKFILALALLTSFSAFSAEVVSAKLDASKKNVLVDVKYGGGCKKHTFSLKLGGCLESLPVQCTAELVETVEGGFDFCEAYISDTAVINLAKSGIKGKYFKGGTLTIVGEKDFRGNDTSATIRLP